MISPMILNTTKRLMFLLLIITSYGLTQDASIKNARDKLNDGDIKEAIETLREILKDYPESADAYYWLGMAYYKNGQINDALNSAMTAYTLKPKHLLNRYLLLDIYLQSNNFIDAKKEVDYLLKESPKDLNLSIRNAECLIGLNQFESASIQLSKLEVQKELPQSYLIKVLVLLGDVYAAQNITPTAISYYSKAVLLSENSVDTHLKLGKVLFKDRRYNEALKEFLEVVRLDSDSDEGNLNVGYIYFNGGKSNPQQYGNAIYYLLKYVQLAPADYRGYLYIGKSYYALRSYRNAIGPFKSAIELDTTDQRNETLKYLAECYSAVQENFNAIQSYEELLKNRYELEAKDYARLGILYKTLKDTVNTIKCFDMAASMDSAYQSLFLDIGLMYYAGRNYQEAARWFERRVAASPNDSNVSSAWQNLGLAQFYSAKTTEDTIKAIFSVRKAISLKPSSQPYWLILAQICEYADSVESAKTAYQVVADIDTSDAQAYYGLASIAYRLKDNDVAIGYFTKVMNLDHKFKYAPYFAAQCYLRQKKNFAAIPFLKKYLELDPEGQFAANAKFILKQLGANGAK